jgi:glucose/arabinose dehydrogenase
VDIPAFCSNVTVRLRRRYVSALALRFAHNFGMPWFQSLSALVFLALHAGAAHARIVHSETVDGIAIAVREIATGLHHPWGLAFVPDGSGRALVSERNGGVRLIDTQTGEVSPRFSGVPRAHVQGFSGFFDIAISPQFARDRTIFLAFAAPTEQGSHLALAAMRWDGSTSVSSQTVFQDHRAVDNTHHLGGRIAFARDGTLFLTTGDRLVHKFAAQRVNGHHGKVLRLNADGSAPADNPFAHHGRFARHVWSLGHRNAQGAAIHPLTGALWASEHGPQGGDEINVIVRGKNYGWPTVGFGKDYSGRALHYTTQLPQFAAPAHVWLATFAVSGINFYLGDRFPAWKHRLFAAGLAGRSLAMLTIEGDRVVSETRLLQKFDRRLRQVVSGPDGFLYVLTDEGNGSVVRIEPAAMR